MPFLDAKAALPRKSDGGGLQLVAYASESALPRLEREERGLVVSTGQAKLGYLTDAVATQVAFTGSCEYLLQGIVFVEMLRLF